MSTEPLCGAPVHCECHEGHSVADIGNWLVRAGVGDLVLVRDWAQSGIWEEGRCRLSHAEMTSLIRAANGITCDYALDGRKLLSGEIELVDGMHRWTVADELGVDVVPVKMVIETEPVWAW